MITNVFRSLFNRAHVLDILGDQLKEAENLAAEHEANKEAYQMIAAQASIATTTYRDRAARIRKQIAEIRDRDHTAPVLAFHKEDVSAYPGQ